MKKLLLATAATALVAGAASAEDISLGIALGFTGPAESLAPNMAAAAELAMAEASESGLFMDGSTITPVRGDTACVDASVATGVAERLVTSDGVKGIMGALCSGATTAVLANVAMPNGVVLISPSSTSPALSDAEDNGFFFRTAPSDARQGQVLTDVLVDRGIESVALTYTNNDYGKGLADSFQAAFEAAGGEVTISTAHEDGKADYSAEVGALASAGGDILVVAGYLDQGGRGIIQSALDTGAFDTFALPDGMIGDSLIEAIGSSLDGSFGTVPGTDSEGVDIFSQMMLDAGSEATPYTAESYDAAALMILAMAAAGSTDPNVYKDSVMDVANAPGEPILPGELAKALELIAAGEDVDYVGASAVELIGGGESAGSFREVEVDGGFNTVQFR